MTFEQWLLMGGPKAPDDQQENGGGIQPPPYLKPQEDRNAAAMDIGSAAAGALTQPFTDSYKALSGQMTEDEQKQFALNAALMGLGGLPGRLASKAAPWVTGAVAGSAMVPTDAQAADTRLTREQRQAVELEKQKANNAARIESERTAQQAALERQRQVDSANNEKDRIRIQAEMEAKNRQDQFKLEMDRQAAEDKRAADMKAKEVSTPFGEKYPDVAKAMALGGLGAAAGIPIAGRGVDALKKVFQNSRFGQWGGALNRAEGALAPETTTATSRAASKGELKSLLGDYKPPTSSDFSPGVAAGSGLLAFEGTNLPNHLDWFDANTREHAMKETFDPQALMRIPAALGAGIAAGYTGNKLSSMMPVPGAPTARASGLYGALDNYRAPPKPKAPAAKKSKKKADQDE